MCVLQYAEQNRREYEITRRFSLNDLHAIALLRLRIKGSCEFDVPELAYDLDRPGHCFRRPKTVSLSVPCVVGPYTSVAGTLTLLENRLRVAPVPSDDEAGLRTGLVPVQSMATGAGSGDSGMFELDFHDERYLPFEGAGAISRWRFELPTGFRAFDYTTITDLVLTVRYTARDGGAAFRQLYVDGRDRMAAAGTSRPPARTGPALRAVPLTASEVQELRKKVPGRPQRRSAR